MNVDCSEVVVNIMIDWVFCVGLVGDDVGEFDLYVIRFVISIVDIRLVDSLI